MIEQTYDRIEHPETLPDGRGLWVSPEVAEVSRQLREGVPEVGWEGDNRLALYRGEKDDHWELWRLEADGEYRMVVRSKPGVNLMGLVPWLVVNDARRHLNPIEDVISHNEALYHEADRLAQEAFIESMDRVAYGIRKDLGDQTDIGPGKWTATLAP